MLSPAGPLFIGDTNPVTENSQVPRSPKPLPQNRPNQIFATKSIDKLIADSERPEHSLKKTLGPVSLTALGVGIVIGSGIFTVIGTAIAGKPLKIAGWTDSPVIDLLLHHGAIAGRPGAGPALALSLTLGSHRLLLHRAFATLSSPA